MEVEVYSVDSSKTVGVVPEFLTNDRGEPAVRYRWTGWDSEITGWTIEVQDCRRIKLPMVLEEVIE